MLNTAGNIFLGGGPAPGLLTGGRWSAGFQGCLHSLALNGKDVDFKTDTIRTANVLPCTNAG